MIDQAALAKTKPGVRIINCARGGLVVEEDLREALISGHVAGAALDVFAQEPVDSDAGAVFLSLPNLILTPHIAGVTEESNVRVSAMTADNVRKVLEDTK